MKHRRGISGNCNSNSGRHALSNAPPIADRVNDATDDHVATASAVERERRIVATLEAQLALLRRVGGRKRRRSSTTPAAVASRGREGNADAHGSGLPNSPGAGGGDWRDPTRVGGNFVDDHHPSGNVGPTSAREDVDAHVVYEDLVDGPRGHQRRASTGEASSSRAAADVEADGTADGPGSDGERGADGEEIPPESLGEFRSYGDASRCARNLLDILDMLGSQSTRAAEEAVVGTLNNAAGRDSVGSSYRYVANPMAIHIAPLASGVYFTDVRVVPVPDVDGEGTGYTEGPRLDHDCDGNAPEGRSLRRTRYELCGAVLRQMGDLSFRIDVTAALPRRSTRKARMGDRASEEARVEALVVKFMKRKDRAVVHEEKNRADGIPSDMDNGDDATLDPVTPVQETATSSSSMTAPGTLAQAPAVTVPVLDRDTSACNRSPDRSSKPEQHYRNDCQNYFPTDELSELTSTMTTTSTSPVCRGVGVGGGGRMNVPRLFRAIVTFAEFDSKRRRTLYDLRLRYGDDRLRLVSAHEFHVRILAPRTPRPPGGDAGTVGGDSLCRGSNVIRCVLCLTWRWTFSSCGRGKERLTLEDVVCKGRKHKEPLGSNSGDVVSSMPGLEEITDDNLQRLVSSIGGDAGCELAVDSILQATSFQC